MSVRHAPGSTNQPPRLTNQLHQIHSLQQQGKIQGIIYRTQTTHHMHLLAPYILATMYEPVLVSPGMAPTTSLLRGASSKEHPPVPFTDLH